MTDESAPPPPPLSPPPTLKTTTIAKYIARFRYEKPQPREVRVAAQRSDFWWTKSPRYTRSPSPPSTWASGDAFVFPDEELDDELTVKIKEKGDKTEEEDDGESVDSIESKLRRRLGLDSHEINDKKVKLAAAKEIEQSWGSLDLSSVEMEEEEEEEDPELVIERVRRRLGWGSSSSRLKPIEFQLSIDRKATGRRQFGLKPPLSPGSFRKGQPLESFDSRSDSCWRSIERDDGEEKVSAEAKDHRKRGSEGEGKEEVNRSSTIEITGRRGSGSSAEGSETQSVHDKLSSTDFATSSSSCIQCTVPHESSHETLVVPANERFEEVRSNTFSAVDTSDSNDAVEKQDEKPQLPLNTSDHFTVDEVPELPLLPTASPARPDSVLEITSPSRNDELSERSQGSSSSSSRRESETAKTLDNLVSLVVHSWENDFFSTSEREQEEIEIANNKPKLVSGNREELIDAYDTSRTLNAPTSPNVSHPTLSEGSSEVTEASGIQELTVPESIAENVAQVTTPADIIDAPNKESTCTQPNPDNEEKKDTEVPGEEDDEIVQMLLRRIALLEEALRQIDS